MVNPRSETPQGQLITKPGAPLQNSWYVNMIQGSSIEMGSFRCFQRRFGDRNAIGRRVIANILVKYIYTVCQ